MTLPSIPQINAEITPATAVEASDADLADILVAKFSERITPIEVYVGALYGAHHFRYLTLDQKLRTLRVAAHAGRFVDFRNSFERRRVILEALSLAERLLKDDETPVYAQGDAAEIIGQLATAYALTFTSVEDI